jgi:adenylate kinase family enzyme
MEFINMENINLGKKIMVIGSCGAGKTILAIQLNGKINIPIIHLDKEYWKPGWKETQKEEWQEKQKKLVDNESWIIDGNYGGTFDIRFSKADTVIFLDYNRYICLYRVIKRWLKNIGKNRVDMGEGCIEKIDLQFIKFVWEFPKKSRYKIIKKLEEYNEIKKIILKSPKEAKLFLKKVKIT